MNEEIPQNEGKDYEVVYLDETEGAGGGPIQEHRVSNAEVIDDSGEEEIVYEDENGNEVDRNGNYIGPAKHLDKKYELVKEEIIHTGSKKSGPGLHQEKAASNEDQDYYEDDEPESKRRGSPHNKSPVPGKHSNKEHKMTTTTTTQNPLYKIDLALLPTENYAKLLEKIRLSKSDWRPLPHRNEQGHQEKLNRNANNYQNKPAQQVKAKTDQKGKNNEQGRNEKSHKKIEQVLKEKPHKNLKKQRSYEKTDPKTGETYEYIEYIDETPEDTLPIKPSGANTTDHFNIFPGVDQQKGVVLKELSAPLGTKTVQITKGTTQKTKHTTKVTTSAHKGIT